MSELTHLLTVNNMVALYPIPFIGGIAKRINFLLGVDIPRSVVIGKGVKFPHNSFGTAIHNNTILEDNVKVYQNVTIGRADVYKPREKSNPNFKGFHIKKGACICAGAKILCKEGTLVVGENTVIAANAVLLQSTGDNEIWAGVPAKLIGYRDDL